MEWSIPRTASKAVIILASLAAALAVAWPGLVSGRVGAFGDNLSFWAPSTAFWTSEVKEGRLPLWNPYVLGGVPFAADINHGLFYPPHWTALWGGAGRAFGVLVFLHVAIAGVGITLVLVHEGVAKPAAAAAGAMFALSTPYLSLFNHIVMLESMSYLPFVVLGALMLAKKPTWIAAAVPAAALALSALAGDVHATYMAALAAGIVLVVKVVPAAFAGEARRAGLAVGFFALSGVAALLLAAASVFPAVQLLAESRRAAAPMSYAAQLGLDARGGIEIVFSNFWGSIRDGTAWNFRWDNAVYVGLPVIALAAYAARRVAARLAPILLVLVGAMLAFGEENPVWRVAYAFLPGFRNFRQPREYFVIAAFGLVWLTACGLGDIWEGSQRQAGKARRAVFTRARIVFLVVFLVAAAVAATFLATDLPFSLALGRRAGVAGELAQSVAGRAVMLSASLSLLWCSLFCVALVLRRVDSRGIVCFAVICAVIAADYVSASSRRLVWGPSRLYEGSAAAASIVRPALLAGASARFAPTGPGFAEYFKRYASRRTNGIMPDEHASFETAARLKESLVDNEVLYCGLESALGYSTFLPKRYTALYEIASAKKISSPVRLVAFEGADWALLGVGALLRCDPSWFDPYVGRVDSAGAIFMAYQWRRADDLDSAAGQLASGRSKAFTEPVIEGRDADSPGPPTSYGAHSIENITRTVDSVELLVHTDQPGMLVVMDNVYPGWRVYDNGIEKKVLTANLSFRALYLASGRHEVKFAFRPAIVYVGVLITVVSTIVLLGACALRALWAWRQ